MALPGGGGPLTTRSALVVDDSMLVRHTVCRFLEERGFAVESACNGTEAIQVLQKFRPDLIVTDLTMPHMGGSEFITHLKADAATASIPVIVLAGRTALSEMPTETRADFVICKDIDMVEQLQQTLSQALPSPIPAGLQS